MKLSVALTLAATTLGASAYNVICVPSIEAINWKYTVDSALKYGGLPQQTTASPALYADLEINGKNESAGNWAYGIREVSQLEKTDVTDTDDAIYNFNEHVLVTPAPNWYSWGPGFAKEGNLDEFRALGNEIIDKCIKNYIPGVGSAGKDKALAIAASKEEAELLQKFNSLF